MRYNKVDTYWAAVLENRCKVGDVTLVTPIEVISSQQHLLEEVIKPISSFSSSEMSVGLNGTIRMIYEKLICL